ncbi:MAG: sigma-70 family RNA polymerase sigma factor [Candidatus Levybacteria bacterium]|nr:sigma-70 family RNA polymerase sigma factor [Candidatus Levybacteria bacterium]MBI2622777.1 sigma-70 family RNA polymerase sigma factor [Candidatus Levybacteria bacterium]MBI3070084.1 sigma-70 family RNA polymerase sigma factor [Candidatus Levybacteria bacterium]MBI3093201.1 sigma-70 family RNA polymerase sigma factor [Candidatus Levybacteria bacterium]
MVATAEAIRPRDNVLLVSIPDWVIQARDSKDPLLCFGREIPLHGEGYLANLVRILSHTSAERQINRSTLTQAVYPDLTDPKYADLRLSVCLTEARRRFRKLGLEVVNPIFHKERAQGIEALYFIREGNFNHVVFEASFSPKKPPSVGLGPEQFEEFFNIHKNTVYAYVLGIVHDPTEAEDITSEAFLRAWRARDHHRLLIPFNAWLKLIAKHIIIDGWRTKKQDYSLEQFPNIRSRERTPEDAIDHMSVSDQLRAVIADLTPDQRRVLTLRFYEGYSNEEIEALLGKKSSAVRALQFRALKRLCKLLTDQDPELRNKEKGKRKRLKR